MIVKTKRNYNRYMFGLGTIGRDMLYTIVSMYLLFFLTDILDLPDSTMWWMTGAMTILRVFDAVNDPIMGFLVDNTRSRFGKFKPWIVIGGIVGGFLTVLLFFDFGLSGTSYVTMFVVIYLLWDFTYGANDIAYWSMLPSLTLDQKEREKTGSFARICANIGLFTTVVGILPFTNALGGDKRAWQITAIVIVLVTWAFLMFTVFGVKEDKNINVKQESTSLKEMFSVLFHNDQLLFTAISMALFMIGYSTTTSFGVYFFKYAFKDEGMYSVFAAILGISQLAALSVFPLFSKKFSRKTLYAFATILVVAGYVIFFLSPMSMLFIGAAGILLFTGQAFIQLLMLMFLTDTVEYGQWKLGRRNESITFSVQPFINKIGGAIANGIVGVTLIVSGINAAKTPNDVTDSGLLIMKLAMLILPLIFIVIGYIIYYKKFRIDKQMYDSIISQLAARGDINA
ncbi:glycoside-pentoside-hexuronide (GPH):cation symporter [Clostridium swellfunianum]|uniref:glycoside-pentoside-hexuronide (GPH):cation symporter n=1 Tax=Clostridium swellfunianum TaxID=1367462 RepID=UPI00202EED8D|nr:glycoside-pentoside-hexuronide (GPH):cation symporter [Clostridium swellfunianum]MCM0648925.1 glycoside-pentoside-hexuronide (GPH):cation symporter [Clostridium swellfunianum]